MKTVNGFIPLISISLIGPKFRMIIDSCIILKYFAKVQQIFQVFYRSTQAVLINCFHLPPTPRKPFTEAKNRVERAPFTPEISFHRSKIRTGGIVNFQKRKTVNAGDV
jgi:hypothetical protein